ncbi:MAG: hypothetical protein K6G06_07015 [Butyrivibrio sp.]|nr:hypothetical protein [Butyrivibrio sp.]
MEIRTKIGKQFIKVAALFIAAVLSIETVPFSKGITAHASIKEMDKAWQCTFIIPEGFVQSKDKGVYVNKHYPLESANISYSVTEIPQDRVLTNQEKAEGKDAETTDEDLRYDELTADMYEEIQKENYSALYGEAAGYTLENFEGITIDGFTGYKITESLTGNDEQRIHQVAYIILSSNKIFTIVYSRADDDYFEEAFEESQASIHVRKIQ